MTERDLETWMWERANDLLDQLDKLQRQLFQPGIREGCPTWQPPVDVFETLDALHVIVALPGVDPVTVEVLIDGRKLLVRGTRSLGDALPAGCQEAAVNRLELPQGRFERCVELPPGSYDRIEKRFVHGCLVLSVRKAT